MFPGSVKIRSPFRPDPMPRSRHIRRNVLAAWLAVAGIVFGQPQLTGSAALAHFYYFNPDSPQSNLSNLKQSMEAALNAQGLVFNFQPFIRFQDFNRQVRDGQPALVFLPEWFLRQDGNSTRYKPLLIPVHNGRSTYRKVLMVPSDSTLTAAQLPGATIAMTPLGEAGLVQLDEALFKGAGLRSETLNFITTAKDVDALFALALGQVKAAVISEDNLNHIASINPKILATVKSLAVSSPIPLPLLCYADGAIPREELNTLRASLLAGKQDKNVAQLMELLDIDGWREPTP